MGNQLLTTALPSEGQRVACKESPVQQPRAGLEKNFGLNLSNGQVRF